MRVALINTPFIELYGPIKIAAGRYFPLGIGYIAAVLKMQGCQVRIIDPEAEGLDYSDVRETLKNFNPDIVGLSSATPNFGQACKIARIAREENVSTIILGGAHASSVPELVLTKCADIDLVAIGEGEGIMSELCAGKSLQEIDGIAYRKDGKIQFTVPRDPISNVDSLPLPARELVDLRLYRPNTYVDRGKNSVTLITSRGCPSRCVFCASHTTLGRRFRAHSPEYVLHEMEYLMGKYGIKHFIFNDDTFTMNKNRVMEICSLILQKNMKIEWYCFARVDTLDRELLSMMIKAGCNSIGFGIESGDATVLRNLKKGITLEQSRKAMRICNEFGLETYAFFILGSPGETLDSVQRTVNFSKEIRPTLAFFNMMVPYPGTEVFNNLNLNSYTIDNWEDFVAIGTNSAVLSSSIPKDELQRLVSKANCSFYLRPFQIYRILKQVRTWKRLKTYMLGGYGLLMQVLSLKRWKR